MGDWRDLGRRWRCDGWTQLSCRGLSPKNWQPNQPDVDWLHSSTAQIVLFGGLGLRTIQTDSRQQLLLQLLKLTLPLPKLWY